MDKEVLATITTFNPEIDLLEKNIDSVITQVDKIIIYENDSINRSAIIDLCAKKNIEIVLNIKNEGVAGPLHDGIIYAVNNGYHYILTLDQDSISSNGMVEYLLNKFQFDEKLAVASAQPIGLKPDIIRQDKYVDSVITSGSLFDVDKINQIGNYIPEMFIDWVDIEICYRIQESGYKIMQCPIPLVHRLGSPVVKRLLWKTCVVTNYPQERLYYIWRNSYYCFKRYRRVKNLTRYCKHSLLKMKIKILFFESKKREKFAAIKRGKQDSIKFYKEISNKYKFNKQ